MQTPFELDSLAVESNSGGSVGFLGLEDLARPKELALGRLDSPFRKFGVVFGCVGFVDETSARVPGQNGVVRFRALFAFTFKNHTR